MFLVGCCLFKVLSRLKVGVGRDRRTARLKSQGIEKSDIDFSRVNRPQG